MQLLVQWYSQNLLKLNPLNTVVKDLRRESSPLHIIILNNAGPTTDIFRFLGTTISSDLKYSTHKLYLEEGSAVAGVSEAAQVV